MSLPFILPWSSEAGVLIVGFVSLKWSMERPGEPSWKNNNDVKGFIPSATACCNNRCSQQSMRLPNHYETSEKRSNGPM